MHHAVLSYNVRLNNLGSVDIVYAVTDANDQAFALLGRQCSAILEYRQVASKARNDVVGNQRGSG